VIARHAPPVAGAWWHSPACGVQALTPRPTLTRLAALGTLSRLRERETRLRERGASFAKSLGRRQTPSPSSEGGGQGGEGPSPQGVRAGAPTPHRGPGDAPGVDSDAAAPPNVPLGGKA